MKKKVIAIILSLILASGSLGIVQVRAADTTGQEEGAAEEETIAGEEEDALPAGSEEEPVEEEDALDTMAAGNAVQSGSCGDHIKWKLTGTGNNLTLILSGSGPMEYYEEAKDVPWDSYRDKIKKVVVKKGITDLADYVFYAMVRLTDVSLPDSLESISNEAFENCKALKSIRIPDSVSYIGYSAFSDCSSLTSIVIPDGVMTLKDSLFLGCSSLKSVTIPSSVVYIEHWVFDKCDNLNRIDINDLESWLRADIAEEACLQGSLYLNGKLLTEIEIPKGITEINDGPLSLNESLEKVTIPDSVKTIGSNAFAGCSNLEDINIPDSVTKIGHHAFSGCNSLTDLTIPDSVEHIGDGAFGDCFSIESLTIPDSVTTLGWDAFPWHYDETDRFIIFTCNSYVKKRCKENEYAYFDKTAPSIAKLSSHNGTDIQVHLDQKDEALKVDYIPDKEYVAGYQIKYADNKKMTDAKSIMLKDKKASSLVIKGLENGKTYYVQIQHYMKLGSDTYWSRWSGIKSVTVGENPYPVNVTKLSTYLGSHIKIDWSKAAGVSGYHIKYADNSNMDGVKEVFVKGDSTLTKTLTGLKNGKTYYVKIQTYKTVSGKTYWSSWSKTKSIKVDQIPYGSSIKKLTQVSDSKLKIDWEKAPGTTGYHIQYDYYENDEELVRKDVYVSGEGTLSKTITGLKNNTDYSVRIQTYRKTSGKTFWSSWSRWHDIYIEY